MPFNQVCEGQENRGDNLQGSWLHSSNIAGQKTKGTVEFIVVPISGSQNGNIAFSFMPSAEVQIDKPKAERHKAIMGTVISFPDKQDDRLGLCPKCRKPPDILNVERNQYGVCHKHKVAWLVGTNQFSSWQQEDEIKWRLNAELLDNYRRVKPYSNLLKSPS